MAPVRVLYRNSCQEVYESTRGRPSFLRNVLTLRLARLASRRRGGLRTLRVNAWGCAPRAAALKYFIYLSIGSTLLTVLCTSPFLKVYSVSV